MGALVLQLLNGLEKGAAYALIALGLTLVFGTLGVVNFAHGALFMIGAFIAVTVSALLTYPIEVAGEGGGSSNFGFAFKQTEPLAEVYLGEFGAFLADWSVVVAVLAVIPLMLLVGFVMERGLIRHFYKRPHADQILVTFGLAIVIGEIIKHYFGATPIPVDEPSALAGSSPVGSYIGLGPNVIYPTWRLVYTGVSLLVIAGVFAFLQLTTFGMVVRAGMQDRETVGLLGINIQRRFTLVFGLAAAVAGLAGALYAPIVSPYYNTGMDFLVISFVVVVVGGMGSLPGAVLSGFLLGVLQSLAALNEVKAVLPGIDQVIIYLVAVAVLLTLPRGLLGRKGVMED